MKKHIFLPILVAGAMGIIPLKANNLSFAKDDDSKTKAAALNEKATWMIIFNTDNADSLNCAIKLCSQAIELDPTLTDAFFNRGDASYFLHDYNSAIKDFDLVVDKRGEATDFQYRGECKFNLSDNAGALADFQAAASKGIASTLSGQSLAMNDANTLGIAFYNAANYSDAVKAFTVSVNALKTGTNLFNRANAEYMAGDHPSALADWKQSGKMGNKEGKKSYKKFRKQG